MAALLVYLLFGDRIAQRLSGGEETQDTSTEDVTPQPPDPDTADPEGGDGVTMPESGGTGEMEDPNDGGTTTPAQTDPSTLPETLTIAYLGSPRTEFTMSVGDEPIPLTVSGGSGTYTWSSSDDGIASVDSTGRVTAISSGHGDGRLRQGHLPGAGPGRQHRHIYVCQRRQHRVRQHADSGDRGGGQRRERRAGPRAGQHQQ